VTYCVYFYSFLFFSSTIYGEKANKHFHYHEILLYLTLLHAVEQGRARDQRHARFTRSNVKIAHKQTRSVVELRHMKNKGSKQLSIVQVCKQIALCIESICLKASREFQRLKSDSIRQCRV